MNSRIFLILLIAGIVVLSAGCTTPAGPKTRDTGANATLARAVDAINAELAGVREHNAATAAGLSVVGITGEGADAILRQKLSALPWALSTVTISPGGVIVAAMPEHYRGIVGRDVSYQGPVQKALALKAPLVSEVFMMEEGFAGISQSAPVFAGNGTYLGYTDVTYRPGTLVERAVSPVLAGTPYSLWVVQSDGTIIYDVMPEEIGKNLLSDPSYNDPDLQAVLKRIVSEPSGSGSYRYWDRDWDQEIGKDAVWGTAGIDGAVWRVVLTAGMAPSGTGTAASAGNTSLLRADDLDLFVESAAAFAREKGASEAIGVFNNPGGRFIDGELYIFAYTMNGTVLALPLQPGLIGENRFEVRDPHGVAFIREMVGAASRGGDRLYYVYSNPAAGFRDELKLSSVVPVDDGWFVGSGIYLPQMNTSFTREEKDALMQRVHAARDFAQQAGMDAALSAFNDLSGPWAPGGSYIFAYSMNGTTLALPHQPELIGTSRLGFRDHYGVGIIGQEIGLAREGGGFLYIVYLNPETGDEALKLCYVVPVDDQWFVGSGVYSDTG